MAQMPLSSSRLSPDLAAFVDGWAYSELIFFVVALFVCFGLRPQSLHLEHHKWDCCVVCVCGSVIVCKQIKIAFDLMNMQINCLAASSRHLFFRNHVTVSGSPWCLAIVCISFCGNKVVPCHACI